MARPREFDEAEVLDRALSVFWSKGFDGTSIQDLVEATGLGRASLYGAFGDKHRLYERVLDHYASRVGSGIAAIDDEAPLRAALELLLGRWIGLTCPKAGPRGCFLLLAGTQGSGETAFAREALSASMRAAEKMLVDLLRRAQARGEFAESRDVTAVARLLVVMAQGVATCARAGWSQDRLRSAVGELLDLTLRR